MVTFTPMPPEWRSALWQSRLREGDLRAVARHLPPELLDELKSLWPQPADPSPKVINRLVAIYEAGQAAMLAAEKDEAA